MIRKLCAIAALAMIPLYAGAADWPERPVRMIVPWAPGGQTDAVARLLAQRFGQDFGQPFIVENRPGAGGMIGSNSVMQSEADGYTLLFTSASISVNSTLMADKFKLNPVKDLTPVIWAASEPLILTVPAELPVQSVAELVALSHRNDKGLSGGYNGSGTTSQVALEMLKQQAGANIVTIPYKGGGPSTVALMAGDIDLCFATLATVKPMIETGKLRALATSTPKAPRVLPDLPTLGATYPEFEADNWFGLFGPAGLPAPIVQALNRSAVGVLRAPETLDRITKAGGEVVASSPEQFSRHLEKEMKRYEKVIHASQMRPE